VDGREGIWPLGSAVGSKKSPGPERRPPPPPPPPIPEKGAMDLFRLMPPGLGDRPGTPPNKPTTTQALPMRKHREGIGCLGLSDITKWSLR